jgi:hypothetical protein
MAWIIQDIPEKHRNELAKRVPQMPFALFACAVSNYLAAPEKSEPSPKEVRAELDRVVIAASTLLQMLSNLSFPALDALDDEAQRYGSDDLRQRLRSDLGFLFNCAETARRKADSKVKTNRPNRTTMLICDLARAVEAGGLKADAREAGPLALAFGIALDFLDARLIEADPSHEPIKGRKDITGTLDNALKAWGKH